MLGTIRRKVAPKKWAQVYVERQETIQEQKKEKERKDAAERAFLRKLREDKQKIAEELSLAIGGAESGSENSGSPKAGRSAKLRSAVIECRRTIENLIPPPSQIEWNQHWGSCLVCFMCNRPALTDCTQCPNCNLIFHNLCFSYQNSKSNMKINSSCPNCEESYQSDLDNYHKMIEELRNEKIRELSAGVITRRAHVFLEKKRLKLSQQMVIKIQAMIRRKIARSRYKVARRSLFRVVLLDIMQLPVVQDILPKNMLLVITVVDTFKNIQLFRFDKTADVVFNETILVPGIAAYMTVIITFAVKEEVYTYHMLGQALLSVRDMVNAAHKKEYILNFMEKILYLPQDTEQIKPVTLLTSDSRPKVLSEFAIKLLYQPQNPVLYFCTWASGPPIDMLRRSGQLLQTKKKGETIGGGGTYRNSRYWLCTTHNVLWFYQYYGDIAPRFGVEISDASGVMVKEKKHTTTLANLILPDGRIWLLDFANKGDAGRFEVAINENRKAHKEGRSIFIKATQPVPNLGFTVPFF